MGYYKTSAFGASKNKAPVSGLTDPGFLRYVAAASFFGAVASLIVHVLSVAGMNISWRVPFLAGAWILAAIVVYVTFFICQRLARRRLSRDDFWSYAVKYAPSPLKVICRLAVIYAMFNLVYMAGGVDVRTMVYSHGYTGRACQVMRNNGRCYFGFKSRIFGEFTPEEYALYYRINLASRTAYFLAIYMVGMTVMLSYILRRQMMTVSEREGKT
jgi:hypothetical protein